MIFILLIFLAALALEGIGTVISILGLVQLFGMNELIIVLAIAFDFAKLVSASFLYKHWKKLNVLMKSYLTLATLVLMTITSAGAAGFLSSNFQKAILPTKAIEVQLTAITAEKEKLELRKREIDLQIANLPADYVKGRTKLLNNFKTEIERVNNRIIELDAEVPKLQIDQIDKNSHAGPITYISSTFNTSPEQAMGYIIALIIFVFDPLAIVLILAGNFLVEKRIEEKKWHPKRINDVIEEKLKKPIKIDPYTAIIEPDLIEEASEWENEIIKQQFVEEEIKPDNAITAEKSEIEEPKEIVHKSSLNDIMADKNTITDTYQSEDQFIKKSQYMSK